MNQDFECCMDGRMARLHMTTGTREGFVCAKFECHECPDITGRTNRWFVCIRRLSVPLLNSKRPADDLEQPIRRTNVFEIDRNHPPHVLRVDGAHLVNTQ